MATKTSRALVQRWSDKTGIPVRFNRPWVYVQIGDQWIAKTHRDAYKYLYGYHRRNRQHE